MLPRAGFRLYALLTAWAALHGAALAGWTLQNPVPTGNALKEIRFSTPAKGWAAGDRGVLLKSSDSGATWTLAAVPTQNWIRSIAFADSQNGLAVGGVYGRACILETRDGGADWRTAGLGIPQGYLQKAYFDPSGRGWILGPGREPNAYTAGSPGEPWSARQASAALLNDIVFLDADTGIVVGDMDYIGRTTDGGKSWSPSDVGDARGPFIQVQMLDARIGYTLSYRGQLVKTEDGGKTWKRVLSVMGITTTTFRFDSPDTGVVFGGSTVVISTRDGGLHWDFRERPDLPSIQKVASPFPGTLMAAADDGSIYRIHQSNGEFEPVTKGNGPHLYRISFADPIHGAAYSSDGALFTTEDGGSDWKSGPAPALPGVTGLWRFPGSRILLASRDSLLASDDAGATWQRRSPGLIPVAGPARDSLRVMGLDPAGLVRSNDAGRTWDRVTADPGIASAKAACFVSAAIGFYVSESGAIFRSEDGGASWMPRGAVESMFPLAIAFATPDTGWIGGNSDSSGNWAAVISRTTDGGMTWAKQGSIRYLADESMPTDVSIQDRITRLHASDSREVWALCEAGILRTTDGGSNWVQELLPQTGRLWNDMAWPDKNHGWISGNAASIWAYASDTGSGIRPVIRPPGRRYPGSRKGSVLVFPFHAQDYDARGRMQKPGGAGNPLP